MNRLFGISFMLLVFCSTLLAQEHKNGIGIQMAAFDFYGMQAGKYGYHSYKNILTGVEKSSVMWDPAIKASYWHAFSKRFDLSLAASVADVHYPNSDEDSTFIKAKLGNRYVRNALPYLALDAKLNYSFLDKEKFMFSPYVCAGISATMRKDVNGFDIPAGIGFNIRLKKGLYLNTEANYRLAISEKNQDHLSYAFGIVYWWKGKKEVVEKPKPEPIKEIPKPVPVIAKDTDNDGVVDSVDRCPYHAGPRDKAGCPDKDNDGVYDFEDLCPNEKGLALYNGCADTDGDGIPDKEDRCPTEAGVRENQGCPAIKEEVIEKVNMAAKGVNFETGKAVLTDASFKQLDVIVEALQANLTLNVDIEGHTDNKGKPDKNLLLSQQRADVCRDYLVNKGVSESRISSVGYGDMKPIADNATAEGRAQNRRTEFLLKN